MIKKACSRLLALSLFSFFLIACDDSNFENHGSFLLLPSSQELSQNGFSTLNPNSVRIAYSPTESELPLLFEHSNKIKPGQKEKAQIEFLIDPDLETKAEGYSLKIGAERIEIKAKDEAGLFYAFVSLDQILEDAWDQQSKLPLMEVLDFPSLGFRPIHWDVKHHMEKEEYYYQLLDQLARQKINGVIVEFEDKLKYESRPEVGSKDGFSIQQWIDLSNYAAERHISINPLVQGLGHASFILKHEKNFHLRDDPESDWAFNPLDPETYELQFDLYRDAIRATPHGKFLHVGGDEVETTGRGSGISKLELNLIWLNKVSAFAEEQGRTPIFWDDMPLKQAGVYYPMFDKDISPAEVDEIWEDNSSKLTKFVDQFPKNLIYMRWNYSSPETYGNVKAMDWFSSQGFEVMGATAGQTRFKLMPQNESNIDPIRSFALSSIEKNFRGLLLTLWDDDSPHFELYKRGIAAFAEYSWAGDTRSKEEFKQAFRHRHFGPSVASNEFAFIDDLEEPVTHWNNLLVKEGTTRNHLVQLSNKSEDGIIEMPDLNQKGLWSEKHADRIAKTRSLLEQAQESQSRIQELMQKGLRNNYGLEVYEQVTKLVQFSYQSFLSLAAYDSATSEEEEKKALENLDVLQEKYEEMRIGLEAVYSKTRVLVKPDDYILDQDHHVHLANQSTSFDWQFNAEMKFLEKVQAHFDQTTIKDDSEVLDKIEAIP